MAKATFHFPSETQKFSASANARFSIKRFVAVKILSDAEDFVLEHFHHVKPQNL